MLNEKCKVFLGVVILIGVLYKSNNESVEQLWSTHDGRPIFNRSMSRRRYQQILRFLRFDNAQSRLSSQFDPTGTKCTFFAGRQRVKRAR